jgi:hypothetical protein
MSPRYFTSTRYCMFGRSSRCGAVREVEVERGRTDVPALFHGKWNGGSGTGTHIVLIWEVERGRT